MRSPFPRGLLTGEDTRGVILSSPEPLSDPNDRLVILAAGNLNTGDSGYLALRNDTLLPAAGHLSPGLTGAGCSSPAANYIGATR